MRHGRGVLFVDYVRMLRSQKAVDWSQHLAPEDLAYLRTQIDPASWYPMATFERMGNGIMRHIAHGNLEEWQSTIERAFAANHAENEA